MIIKNIFFIALVLLAEDKSILSIFDQDYSLPRLLHYDGNRYFSSEATTKKYLQMKYFNCFLLFVGLLSCSKQAPQADLIVRGGKIYTVEEGNTTVEAVAVKGDKIIFAGTEKEGEKYKNEKTQVIDLQGKTMTPGLIEGHGHLLGLGFSELTVNLANVKSYEELVGKVKEAVSKVKPGDWIIGRGWHQDKWDVKPKKMIKGFQTNELLNSVSRDNPVYLTHANGHASFVNGKAMEIAGLNQLSKEQLHKDLGEGGEIIRDPLGNPTGILVDHATLLVEKFIPPASIETLSKVYESAIDACLKNGITSFQKPILMKSSNGLTTIW